MRNVLACSLLLTLGFACTADTADPPDAESKADARRMGKIDGWDWCELFDWYGDGECDDFCDNPDPDCDDPLDVCDTDADCPGGYCATFASCLAIGCPPPPPNQCIYPNCDDGTTALCAIVPPTCGEGEVLAVISSCYSCVDARTCDVPEPTETFCGGLIGALCGDGQFCDYAADAGCGRADGGGVCRDIPTVCDRGFRPVCGCDGNTYSNACGANAAGVSVESEGACEVACEPITTCGLTCDFGYATDEDGCELCECEPSPIAACGTLGGVMCEADEYCNFPEGANCGRTDAGGSCAPRPEFCPAVVMPVCGCDGRTYNNSCEAGRAGVSVETDGACEPETCGGEVCDDGEECQFCFGGPACVPRGAMC